MCCASPLCVSKLQVTVLKPVFQMTHFPSINMRNRFNITKDTCPQNLGHRWRADVSRGMMPWWRACPSSLYVLTHTTHNTQHTTHAHAHTHWMLMVFCLIKTCQFLLMPQYVSVIWHTSASLLFIFHQIDLFGGRHRLTPRFFTTPAPHFSLFILSLISVLHPLFSPSIVLSN